MTTEIAVTMEVEDDTLVESLLEVVEHKHEEIKSTEVKGRLD